MIDPDESMKTKELSCYPDELMKGKDLGEILGAGNVHLWRRIGKNPSPPALRFPLSPERGKTRF